jgi:type IV secretory pathway TrbF-like protein
VEGEGGSRESEMVVVEIKSAVEESEVSKDVDMKTSVLTKKGTKGGASRFQEDFVEIGGTEVGVAAGWE